jgi:hypothetical protein
MVINFYKPHLLLSTGILTAILTLSYDSWLLFLANYIKSVKTILYQLALIMTYFHQPLLLHSYDRWTSPDRWLRSLTINIQAS